MKHKLTYISVLYLFFINFIFIILSNYILIDRALINIDYVLYIVISVLIRPCIACASIIIFLIFDAIMSAKSIFYFDAKSIALSFPKLQAIELLNNDLFVLTLFGFIILASMSYTLSRFVYRKYEILKSSTLIILIVLGADAINGTSGVISNVMPETFNSVTLPTNIGTSQTGKFTYDLFRSRKALKSAAVESASEARLVPVQDQTTSDHQMLVVVESWGQSTDPAYNEIPLLRLLTPDLFQRYKVHRGTVPFNGATTSGEMREFCGILASFINAGELGNQNCIPGRFAANGYETYAFHGFTETFFNRQQWFPVVGFKHLEFGKDNISRKCGIFFRGQCDTDILLKIAELMRRSKEKKTFVYFLTLNTHLPNDAALADGSPAVCPGTATDKVCTLLKAHENFFASLAGLLKDPTLPPIHIVLVGDHAPPFADLKSRQKFSDKVVPFLEIVPK